MAQPVNNFDTFNVDDIFEDILPTLYTADYDEVPFFSRVEKVGMTGESKEWVTDALRSSRDNAQLQGDMFTPTARTATVRLGNYPQIVSDVASVSASLEASDKVGRGKQMAHEMMKIGKELRFDVERAMFANQAKVAPASDTPGRMAGIPSWIVTNTLAGTGAAADPSTGDGTSTRTDGTAAAFSQDRFDTIMQTRWENSNGSKRMATVFMSPYQRAISLDFTGSNNQRNTIQAQRGRNVVINDVDVYVTPWGEAEFVSSVEVRDTDVCILDMSMWCVAEKRGFTQYPLAKVHDGDQRAVVWEGTLVAKNEKSSAIIADCSTS